MTKQPERTDPYPCRGRDVDWLPLRDRAAIRLTASTSLPPTDAGGRHERRA